MKELYSWLTEGWTSSSSSLSLQWFKYRIKIHLAEQWNLVIAAIYGLQHEPDSICMTAIVTWGKWGKEKNHVHISWLSEFVRDDPVVATQPNRFQWIGRYVGDWLYSAAEFYWCWYPLQFVNGWASQYTLLSLIPVESKACHVSQPWYC